MIRLLLVDDHESTRAPLAFLLNHQPDLSVVGEAGSLAEARAMLAGVDVGLLDLDLPDGSGATLIRELRAVNPTAVSIVLTASTVPTDFARAIEQGASGALHKTAPIGDIITAIRRAAAGESVHTPAEIGAFLERARQQRVQSAEREQLRRQLTPRELELIEALALGLGDQEIAERMHISVRTVQSHMQRLFDKLEVDSRLQALVVAVRNDLVQIEQR